MSIRVDGTDELRITTSLPSPINFTICMWFWYPSVIGAGNWQGLWELTHNTGQNNHFYAEWGNEASQIDVWGDDSLPVAGLATTAATWHFYAAVMNSSENATQYIAAATAATISSASGACGHNVTAPALLRLSETIYGGEDFDGRYAAVKVWEAELTADEIARERWSIKPQRTANLYGWWPMFPGSTERLRDYSGNGHNWSVVGTVVDEVHPPVPWGFYDLAFPPIAVGGAPAVFTSPIIPHFRIP